MKTITCYFLLLIVALRLNTLKAEGTAIDTKLTITSAETCLKEAGLISAELKLLESDELYNLKNPEPSKNIKCFIHCFYKKVGIIQSDGSKNLEIVLYYFQQKFPEKKDAAKEAVEKCASTKKPDACDEIYALESCIWNNLAN